MWGRGRTLIKKGWFSTVTRWPVGEGGGTRVLIARRPPSRGWRSHSTLLLRRRSLAVYIMHDTRTRPRYVHVGIYDFVFSNTWLTTRFWFRITSTNPPLHVLITRSVCVKDALWKYSREIVEKPKQERNNNDIWPPQTQGLKRRYQYCNFLRLYVY